MRVLGDVCPLATNPGNINYQTSWGNAPTTASQVLRIIDANGTVVRTNAINRDSATTSSLTITTVTPGVYVFKATMYSQADAGGVVIGETAQVVDLCGNTVTVRTSNSLPITAVVMSQS
ncbi:MAG TPA: hypothetical protein VNI20_06420, partial [Fimbriimonadaceae bacterium]|nr:hypothetical protein [Fimbriimonadaceae bacterium]